MSKRLYHFGVGTDRCWYDADVWAESPEEALALIKDVLMDEARCENFDNGVEVRTYFYADRLTLDNLEYVEDEALAHASDKVDQRLAKALQRKYNWKRRTNDHEPGV